MRLLIVLHILYGWVAHAEQEYVAEVTIGFYSDRDLASVENDDRFIVTMKEAILATARSMQSPDGKLAWKTSGDRVSFDKDSKSLIFIAHGNDPILCMRYANTLAAHLLSSLESKHDVRVYFKTPCSPWGPSMGAVPLHRHKNTEKVEQGSEPAIRTNSTNSVDRTVGEKPAKNAKVPPPSP